VLLPEEPDPIDHLLCPIAGSGEALGQSRVLPLEELNALRRDDPFHSGRFEGLQARLSLEGTAAKGGQLVTEMLDQLLELSKSCDFRSYAV
jgi:hypothetical protein